MNLESKVRKVEDIYEISLINKPQHKEKIERDYFNFILALSYASEGVPIIGIAREFGIPKTTVYGWVKNDKFPYYLNDGSNRAKKIDIEKLLKSKEFAYILGLYQIITKQMSLNEIAVKFHYKKDANTLANLIEGVLGKVSKWEEKNGKYIVVSYSSVRLIKFIKEITDNNSKVPEHIKTNEDLINEYLKGVFFKGKISYFSKRIKRSEEVRKWPRVIISKSNQNLLLEIQKLLMGVGINSLVYKKGLMIERRTDIEGFLEAKLVSKAKIKRLRELYKKHCKLMREDYRGKLGKEKERKRKEKIEREKRRLKIERIKLERGKRKLEIEKENKKALENMVSYTEIFNELKKEYHKQYSEITEGLKLVPLTSFIGPGVKYAILRNGYDEELYFHKKDVGKVKNRILKKAGIIEEDTEEPSFEELEGIGEEKEGKIKDLTGIIDSEEPEDFEED